MKMILKPISFLAVTLILFAFSANAQTKTTKTDEMKTYVIEREIPGAGAFNAEQLKSISQTSCGVLKQMNDIQWMHSYVTGNKIYCIYKAKNEELIKEHAKRGGFPANSISEVANVISPATAE
jgi:hypothetical protein